MVTILTSTITLQTGDSSFSLVLPAGKYNGFIFFSSASGNLEVHSYHTEVDSYSGIHVFHCEYVYSGLTNDLGYLFIELQDTAAAVIIGPAGE